MGHAGDICLDVTELVPEDSAHAPEKRPRAEQGDPPRQYGPFVLTEDERDDQQRWEQVRARRVGEHSRQAAPL